MKYYIERDDGSIREVDTYHSQGSGVYLMSEVHNDNNVDGPWSWEEWLDSYRKLRGSNSAISFSLNYVAITNLENIRNLWSEDD